MNSDYRTMGSKASPDQILKDGLIRHTPERVMNIHYQIQKTKTLQELCDVLNAYDPAENSGHNLCEAVDMSDLPTFGGSEPSDTSEIFSWDVGYLMYQGDLGFYVCPRKQSD